MARVLQMLVSCKNCGARVSVAAAERPKAEFSVTCPRCSKRSYYEPSDLDVAK